MEQAAGSAIRDPLIGTVLDERYRVIRRIGRGGMGIVYLAQHVLIGRQYAIKTLSERTNATEEMVARFHREALAAAAVGSQHVVEVTDMGHLPDGTLYIALEYLDGMELASAVRADGPFSVARAVNIACQLCDALGAVHEKGIVHRDLKPENLFLIGQRGVKDFLKVLDFGICKLLEGAAPASDPDQPALTRTNASLGTPQYMAPEQFQSSARVDQRADIHAVGAILYFMLTGKPPFDAPTMPQLYMRICVEPPPPLMARRPDVPFELDRAIRRAMSKHPEDRFASGAAMKSALQPFANASNERPWHVATHASEPAQGATSSVSSETRRQPTPVAPETALETALESAIVTPRLPENRWRRPALAISLVVGVMCSMGFGAWALAPVDRPRIANKAQSRAPAAAQRDTSALPDVRAQTLEERGSRIPVAKTAPLAARPRARVPFATRLSAPAAQAEPVSSEATPQVSEQAQLGAAHSTSAPEPSSEAADASFHFPRRALKSVF